MKNIVTLCFLLVGLFSQAQQTITGSINHDGLDRTFILYIPASYSADEVVPLLFNFHGYTSSAQAQMFYGDFRPIADRENFIVVHPQGTLDDNGITFWNANFGAEVDDIGFTGALIDHLISEYSIDDSRIYSTGMSNGGFMSYALACDMGDRIAAVASVTGSMTALAPFTCRPVGKPIPVMQVHGTADGVVPYSGGTQVMPIDDVIDFWLDFNNCNTTGETTAVPDINTTDGCTAEHTVYSDCNAHTTLEFFKVFDGEHTWPGSPFGTKITNQDFNASEEVWRFFAQFDLDGRITTDNLDNLALDIEITVSPNPFVGQISIEYPGQLLVDYAIYNALGEEVWIAESSSLVEIDGVNWTSGAYYFHARNKQGELLYSKQLVKLR